MSVGDGQDQGREIGPAEIDLSDLGTVLEAALEADRADPERRGERRAARDAIDELERSGRLVVDYVPSARHKRRSRPRGGESSTG